MLHQMSFGVVVVVVALLPALNKAGRSDFLHFGIRAAPGKKKRKMQGKCGSSLYPHEKWGSQESLPHASAENTENAENAENAHDWP